MTNSSSADEKKILQAIQALDSQVTMADVVARTGLSIEVVSRLLASIAAKTAATLQVGDDGLVRYCFPSNFYYQFYGRGLALSLRKRANGCAEILSFAFKISFGLILLSSVVFILGLGALSRTFLLAYANDFDGIRKLWIEFFSLFRWLAQDHSTTLAAHSINDEGVLQNPAFAFQPLLLNCYLFLFGPGNPNRNLEEHRQQTIAQVVRLNEGVVLAEHLSPYTGASADDDKSIFQILHRFGGYPTVLEDSRIAYVFPDMSARSTVENYAHVEAYLQEKEWQFTGLDWKQTKPVLMLAFSSVLGASICIFLILSARGTQLHHLSLFSLIAAYGCLFLFIPAMRFLVVKRLNSKLRVRNKRRLQFERLIGEPDEELRASLEDVERIRRENQLPAMQQVIYRTDRDYLEQLTDT